MQGARLSCGCLTKENIRRIDGGRRHKKGTAQRIAQTIYMSNAKKRGLSWELSFEDFVRITSSPCFYTGRLPSLKTTAPSGEIYLYNGIDRLDNSKGYSVENCVPCCTVVNEMKRTQTFEGFAALIAEIHNRINVLSEVELGMPLAQNI
jgi:hypothetical protein